MNVVPFEAYRLLSQGTDGLEAPTRIEAPEYSQTIAQPTTIFARIGEHVTPFAVPIDSLAIVRPDYFAQHYPDVPPDNIYWLVTAPKEHVLDTGNRRKLADLATRGGLLAADYPVHPDESDEDARAEIAISSTLAVAGVDTQDVSKGHAHYHYESLADPTPPPTEINTTPAIEAMLEAHTKTIEAQASLETVMTDGDIAQIQDFYARAHERIASDSPIISSWPADELAAILKDPDVLKFVSRVGNTILNTMLMQDARHGPAGAIVDQGHLAHHWPGQQETGQVLFSPGIFRNPDVDTPQQVITTSNATIGHFGRLIVEAGIRPVITFACNEGSNKNVPRLAHIALNRSGAKVDFRKPVSMQHFRMFQLSPGS
jgi:hypothetical protein